MAVLLPDRLLVLADGTLPATLDLELRGLGRSLARIDLRLAAERGLEGAYPADVLAIALSQPQVALLARASARLRQPRRQPAAIVALLPADVTAGSIAYLLLDDFALAPGSAAELALRLQLVRLRHGLSQEPADEPAATLTLDRDTFSVLVGGSPVALTFTEFELLRALYDRRGSVVSREGLARAVWGYDELKGSRVVDVHLWRLRAKLEAAGGRLIETVRNRGYRLL